jgi:hypothetical protein
MTGFSATVHRNQYCRSWFRVLYLVTSAVLRQGEWPVSDARNSLPREHRSRVLVGYTFALVVEGAVVGILATG